MDLGVAQIVVAVITVCVPTLATTLATKSMKKQANKHSTRSDIMQLIIEDHVRAMENKLPENRKMILEEYDEYKSTGGNSYIHAKVAEYEKWYESLTQVPSGDYQGDEMFTKITKGVKNGKKEEKD